MSDAEIYKTLLEEKMKNQTLDFIEFDGWNCHDIGIEECDNCAGWDGFSSRCDCGNRRVTWVLSEDKTFLYAEAY